MDKQGEVTKLIYRGMGMDDHLLVEFQYGGDRYTHEIPNGGFSLSNPSLQLLAFLGKRPSDFSETILEPSHLTVPIIRTGESEYALPQVILERGAKRLEEAVWGPSTHEDAEATPAQLIPQGGGDGDGGGRGGATVEADEEIVVENDPASRGLTVHTEGS